MANARILIVDDDGTLLSIVDSLLQKNGFNTSLANSAEEGFELIDKSLPQIILLDIRMPGMNGYDALVKLKNNNRTKDIPVIMLTSEDDISSVSQALEAGARDYIVKPFDHNNLILRIKKVMSGL
ncbi:MAG: response regulator [Alphaproteobacteria bacterium]|nr:response regulator [Alphaproteobacteria bacterium]